MSGAKHTPGPWQVARDSIQMRDGRCMCSALTVPPCGWCEAASQCRDCGELEAEWAEVDGETYCWVCLDRRSEEFEANRPRGLRAWFSRVLAAARGEEVKPQGSAPPKQVGCSHCHNQFTPYVDEDGDLETGVCGPCRSAEDSFNAWASHEFGDS